MESPQNIVCYILVLYIYIYEIAVAWLSVSVKTFLDVAIEGYDDTTKKFKFTIGRTNILLGENRHLQSAKV